MLVGTSIMRLLTHPWLAENDHNPETGSVVSDVIVKTNGAAAKPRSAAGRASVDERCDLAGIPVLRSKTG